MRVVNTPTQMAWHAMHACWHACGHSSTQSNHQYYARRCECEWQCGTRHSRHIHRREVRAASQEQGGAQAHAMSSGEQVLVGDVGERERESERVHRSQAYDRTYSDRGGLSLLWTGTGPLTRMFSSGRWWWLGTRPAYKQTGRVRPGRTPTWPSLARSLPVRSRRRAAPHLPHSSTD
jgi:hypothetical protein